MAKENSIKGKGLSTRMVRGGTLRSQYGEVSEAIFMNSGFCYDSAEVAESRFNGEAPGFVYSRYLNPSLKMLEDRLVLLEEGAEAACVMASGMAAVFASMMSFLKTGDHVVANRVLFGSCYYIITEIFPRFGISYTLVDDVADLGEWERAIHNTSPRLRGEDGRGVLENNQTPPPQPSPAGGVGSNRTACVFIESPANPTLDVTDIPSVAALAHQAGAKVIVDNIFATPMHQKPLRLGADIVVYSTTKHLDGQGRTLGGAVLGAEDYIKETLLPFHRHTGPALSPFNAWVILKALETFPLRIERHCDNAEKVAAFLESHPKITRVFYPGLASHPQYAVAQRQMTRGGALVAFEVKGGKKAAFDFMNKLEIIHISNNLGDAKSLITHPASTTHSNIAAEVRAQIGISDALLRLSVGLEDPEDLIADLKAALG